MLIIPPLPKVRASELETYIGVNWAFNGGFDLWSNGAGPFAGHGTHTADGWYINCPGSSTMTVDRVTGSLADNAGGSGLGARIIHNHVLGERGRLDQTLATGTTHLWGYPVSFSCRMRCAVANSARLLVVGGGLAGAYKYSDYHTGDDAWQTLKVEGIAPNPTDGGATDIKFGIEFNETGTYYVDNALLAPGATAPQFAGDYPLMTRMHGHTTTLDGGPLPAPSVANYHAKVFSVNGQTLAPGAYTALTWEGVKFDTAGMFSSANPTRLTIPVAGDYLVTGALFVTGQAGYYRDFVLRRNAALFAPITTVETVGIGNSVTQVGVMIPDAQPGQYFEIAAYHNYAGNMFTAGNAFGTATYWEMRKLT